MLKKWLYMLGLCTMVVPAYNQTRHIDSLKLHIAAAALPAEQVNAIFALCEERQSFPADTLFFYLHKAGRLAQKLHSPFVNNQLRFYTAGYYMKEGKTDSVISIINSFIYTLGKDSAEYKLQMKAFFLKGNALIRGGRYKESLNQFYSVLQMASQSGDNFLEVMTRNSIGWAYMDMEQYAKAVGWLRQAIAYAKDTTMLENYSFVYSNLASSYNDLARYDSAEYFILKALRGVQKNQNLTSLANILNIQSDIYINTNRSDSAGKLLEKALQVRRQIGDTFYIVSDIAQLAVFYANNNKTAKGIATAREGIAMAAGAGLSGKLLSLYEALAANYKNAGNFEQYSSTMEKIVALKDSTYKENSVDAMAQIKTTNDLKTRDHELAEQHFVVNKKNIQLYGSLIILLLSVIIFYLLFKQYRQRQKIKMKEALELEKKRAEQAVASAEEIQRKRIAADLHDNLGVQANAILYGTELLQQENDNEKMLVNNLHDTAKDMLVSLRETLWAMKTADVEAADVWLRIINFAKQMQRYYQPVSIQTSGAAPENFYLNSARALNAVLIVQEAVNNAARHAMASMIAITSQTGAGSWQIAIKDDGRGFDVNAMQQKKDSYGLTNMQERAKAAGLQLQIITDAVTGTSVLLQMPFNKL